MFTCCRKGIIKIHMIHGSINLLHILAIFDARKNSKQASSILKRLSIVNKNYYTNMLVCLKEGLPFLIIINANLFHKCVYSMVIHIRNIT